MHVKLTAIRSENIDQDSRPMSQINLGTKMYIIPGPSDLIHCNINLRNTIICVIATFQFIAD